MEIFLTHNKPDGVTVELLKLNDQDYDLFTVTGSEAQVEFWIETFRPGYGLVAQETSRLEGSDLYTKGAFIHKSQSMDLEKALFTLFRGGSKAASN